MNSFGSQRMMQECDTPDCQGVKTCSYVTDDRETDATLQHRRDR